MPSVRFLRRAKFFRIPQEIFRIPQEVFRCRQTHPALACHPQGAEDNDAAVPCVRAIASVLLPNHRPRFNPRWDGWTPHAARLIVGGG